LPFLGIDPEHSAFDELIRMDGASPGGADDLAGIVFLKVDFQPGLNSKS